MQQSEHLQRLWSCSSRAAQLDLDPGHSCRLCAPAPQPFPQTQAMEGRSLPGEGASVRSHVPLSAKRPCLLAVWEGVKGCLFCLPEPFSALPARLPSVDVIACQLYGVCRKTGAPFSFPECFNEESLQGSGRAQGAPLLSLSAPARVEAGLFAEPCRFQRPEKNNRWLFRLGKRQLFPADRPLLILIGQPPLAPEALSPIPRCPSTQVQTLPGRMEPPGEHGAAHCVQPAIGNSSG